MPTDTKELSSNLFLLLNNSRTNGVIINSPPILLHITIICGLSIMQQGSINRMVPARDHNTKNRESVQLSKSLRQVFCNPLYIFEKQSIPFTGSEALLIAVD